MTEALAFFGAFNPPTNAHMNLARFALAETGRDRVVFIPSRSVYIRCVQGKDFAYADDVRLSMLKKAAESRPWMEVADWEMNQDHQPRSYETLCHLRDVGIHAALLMGSDKLPELEHGWRYVQEISREFGIVCLARGKDDCGRMILEDPYLRSLAPFITVLETPQDTREVSSTRVRQAVREIQRLRLETETLVPREILPLPEP